jgi:hypothetical protein
MEAVLTTLLGAILAIGTTIIIESMRRPKLSITIAHPHNNDYTPPPKRPARYARFLYVSVGNQALPWYARWMARGAAIDTWGTISFHHLDDGQNVFGRVMSVRWSGSTEPPIAAAGGTILDPSWLHSLNRRKIQPGESETIDIVARFDDESSCYGWSNENYFCDPIWRNKKWELPKGRYLVWVVIYASKQRFTQSFRLSNEGSRDSFRLEPSQREDEQKIW